MRREVVATGLGAITALGDTFDATFERCLRGEGAISEAIPALRKWHGAAIAAHVDDRFVERLSRHEKSFDRATQFALLAAAEAIKDAALDVEDHEKPRTGVYCGIGLGGATTLESLYQRFYHRLMKIDGEAGDPTLVHPFTVTNTMPNAAASWISIFNGFQGPTQTFSVACASSAVAVGEAYRAIRHGYVDIAIVVGTEAMLAAGPYLAWHALRVMAPANETNLAASCRPFSRNRKGFVLGEGAAAIVLETRERAVRRGRPGYGQIIGYGTGSDASHIAAPDANGQARTMRIALDDAGLEASAVGYINAHGTATQAGDSSETAAIKAVFDTHAPALKISSTKAVHGHVIGAGGALEFAIALKALATRTLPPTAYLDDPDPACDLDYVANHAQAAPDLNVVMSNSFAFGGTNATLIACRTSEAAA